MDDRVSDYIDDLLEQIDKLEKENAALKAEIAELKTPDRYASAGNDVILIDLEETIENEPDYEVIRVNRYKQLPDIFVVRGATDEEGHDFQIIERDTEAEAEAFAASLKNKAADKVEGK